MGALERRERLVKAALSIESDLRSTIRNGLKAFMDLVSSDPLREQAMLDLTQYASRTERVIDFAADALAREAHEK